MTASWSARTGSPADTLSQGRRRLLVVVALSSYPLFVAAWVGLPLAGVGGVAWVIPVIVLGAIVAGTNWTLYRFRRSMAQAPNELLDERQVAVRDRAYLDSYRIFTALTMVVLIIGGILPDALDRALPLTYDAVQPFVWGGILYGLSLPSAVVAWGEPDLDEA